GDVSAAALSASVERTLAAVPRRSAPPSPPVALGDVRGARTLTTELGVDTPFLVAPWPAPSLNTTEGAIAALGLGRFSASNRGSSSFTGMVGGDDKPFIAYAVPVAREEDLEFAKIGVVKTMESMKAVRSGEGLQELRNALRTRLLLGLDSLPARVDR